MNSLAIHAASGLWRQLPLHARRRLMWLLQPKFTAGVCAILLNDRDEVLLMRHRFREEDSWQLPGGYLVRGEELEVSLRRELREETGFEVDVLSFLSAGVNNPLHIDICFVVRVVAGNLQVNATEIADARFFARPLLYDVLAPEYVPHVELAFQRAG